MIHHDVDPNDRRIDSDDLACWLLFYLESHGAVITLTPTQNIHVDLDPMPGMTAAIADRWGPVIARLMPEFRAILLARPNQGSTVGH